MLIATAANFGSKILWEKHAGEQQQQQKKTKTNQTNNFELLFYNQR